MVPIKTDLAHRANYGGRRTQKVQYLVMHYTGNDGDSAEANGNYFKKAINPVSSAHYFVDDDSIVCSVPDDYVAYHCGGTTKYYHPTCRNANSIGVELCDTRRNGIIEPSAKTLQNAAQLVSMLMKKYGIPIENIVMHYDVTHKACPAYWVKDRAGFERFKRMVQEADYMTGEQIYKELQEYLKKQPLRAWAKKELQEAMDMGITDGANPCDLIPRYQAAIMAKRAVEATLDRK